MALLATTARAALRALLFERAGFCFDDILSSLNDLVEADFETGTFVTLCAVVVDPRAGTIQFVNAGHTH